MHRYEVITIIDDTADQDSDSRSLEQQLNAITMKGDKLISVMYLHATDNHHKVYQAVIEVLYQPGFPVRK